MIFGIYNTSFGAIEFPFTLFTILYILLISAQGGNIMFVKLSSKITSEEYNDFDENNM